MPMRGERSVKAPGHNPLIELSLQNQQSHFRLTWMSILTSIFALITINGWTWRVESGWQWPYCSHLSLAGPLLVWVAHTALSLSGGGGGGGRQGTRQTDF